MRQSQRGSESECSGGNKVEKPPRLCVIHPKYASLTKHNSPTTWTRSCNPLVGAPLALRALADTHSGELLIFPGSNGTMVRPMSSLLGSQASKGSPESLSTLSISSRKWSNASRSLAPTNSRVSRNPRRRSATLSEGLLRLPRARRIVAPHSRRSAQKTPQIACRVAPPKIIATVRSPARARSFSFSRVDPSGTRASSASTYRETGTFDIKSSLRISGGKDRIRSVELISASALPIASAACVCVHPFPLMRRSSPLASSMMFRSDRWRFSTSDATS